jgi:hypothetical protein
MKYAIGDIIKIKKFTSNDYLIYNDKIGIILDQYPYDVGIPAYSVLVAGIESKKHFIYEDEIERKLG